MKSNPASVEAYIASLPADRRAAISAVREAILRHLPEGYVEGIGWGMITYAIPLARFPNTYNGLPLAVAALGAQKNYMVVHLMNLYGDAKLLAWFAGEFKKSGKKLDMGKACVRFKSLADLPVELIGQTVARTSVDQLIAWHELSHSKENVAARRAAARAKSGTKRKPRPGR